MKFAVNAPIMFIFKKKLARGEKEINQLSVLLKFVCCRFAFGFSGPPLFIVILFGECSVGMGHPIFWFEFSTPAAIV